MPARRVLVAGVGPIPPHLPDRLYAPGLRLWSLADTLEKHGHTVILAEALFAGQSFETGDTSLGDRRIEHIDIPIEPDAAAERLREIARARSVDCVVGTTDVVTRAVVTAQLPVPCWLDFYGHPMAEAQMLARVFGSDAGISAQWTTVLPSVLGGDHFSVCSGAQRCALLGELGVCGRLNQFTAGVELVDVLPSAVVTTGQGTGEAVIRGELVGDDDMVVLSTGGFNTWMDEQTLFRGLEQAMEADPRIHFVATGGAIRGHNERTFGEFKRRIAASPHRDRFHLRGWVPTETVADYHREADVAVNVDLLSCEGLLGCRNRVIEWVVSGLPVISTPLAEVTRQLADAGLILTFGFGDWRALADQILAVARDRAEARRRAAAAREHVMHERAADRVLAPLLTWIESPTPAPDLPPPQERPTLPVPIAPDNPLARSLAAHCRESTAHRSGFRRLVSAVKRALAG